MIKYFLSSSSESGRNITGMWKVCIHARARTQAHIHGLMWWWFVLFPTFTILCGLRVQEQTENIVYFVLHCRRLINPTGIIRVLKNNGLMCKNPERRWGKKADWDIGNQNLVRAEHSSLGALRETRHENGNHSTVTGTWAGHGNGGWERRSFQVVT